MATAAISVSSSGSTTLVTPTTGKRLVIDGLSFICTDAVGVKFLKDATDLTGVMPFPANGGMVDEDPGFELATNQVFRINLSTGTLVAGWLKYRELD